MKNEAEFNSCISRSLDWAYKIPDAANSLGAFYARCPYDGFGVYNGKPVYWEAKFLPAVKAFNFIRLEEHQIKNLTYIQHSVSNALCLVLIGVYVKRGDLRCYYYTDMDELAKRKLEKRSITKKEFLASNNYIKIQKGLIDFSQLIIF